MQLFEDLDAFLQRIQDGVRTGHHWFVQGSFAKADYAKIRPFSEKLSALYDLELTPSQRNRRRKAGLANAILLGFKRRYQILWVLLASDGEGEFHHLEKGKKSVLQKGMRLEVAGYELLELERPGEDDAVKSTWTWRLTPDAYKSLEEDVIRFAAESQSPMAALTRAQEHLMTRPMFRGVRPQIRRLFMRLRRAWLELHPESSFPPLPAIPFILRKKNKTIPLEFLGILSALPA